MRTFVIRSVEEMPAYEGGWKSLRRRCDGTVHSSYYLTRSWFEAFERSASPRIIVIEDGGEIIGIAPLCSYKYKVKGLPIKVLSFAGDMRGRLRLSINSVMCLPDRPEALDAMIGEMKRLDWSILWTINMMPAPVVDEYIRKVRSTWRPMESGGQDLITVPIPPEGDVADHFHHNARKNLHRKMRKLEREGVQAEFSEVAPDGIDNAVELYAEQHIQRWASKGGSYFRNPENVEFLKLAFKRAYAQGQGFVAELLIDGEVAAQIFIIIEGDQAYGERIGISEHNLAISPGWLVMYHAMNELRSRGVRHLHVGHGVEHYKQVMGGDVTTLVGIGATRGVVSLLSRLPILSPAKMTGPKESVVRSDSTGE